MPDPTPRRSSSRGRALATTAALVLVAAACRAAPRDGGARVVPASPLAAEAVAGVTDAALQRVLLRHWEALLRDEPGLATTLGDHRYDDQLAARDAASIARREAEQDELLAQARQVPTERLDESDRETLALLLEELTAERESRVCQFWRWSIGVSSLFAELSDVARIHPAATPADAANLIRRMRLGRRAIADAIDNLRLGLAASQVAAAETVRRAIAQLDDALAKSPDSWDMASPAWTMTEPTPPWPPGERARLTAELRAVIAQELTPAFRELRAMLSEELLPRARAEREGLAGLPGMEPCYRARILRHVGVARSPEELHRLGQEEIARTDRELAELGARALGTADLAATLARLREDPALYFTSGAELVEAATAALAKAKARIPQFFHLLPKADCVVREIPDHEAPFTTIAYYNQPNLDGSKPGEYFVNTYRPETRPRYELEALTWHEAIPGHHLQIAIAQERGALPAFRRVGGSTAFVEGWALYTEHLAEEMGLYSTDLDRLGRVSYDAWRASRLVVDTGVHHLGWTRAQAEAYMKAHTALTYGNITNEVDRYLSWPGQALAYKVGQLELVRLRAKAEAALGARFDVRAFHDAVLGGGAVSLPVLARRIDAWLDAGGASAP
ncbi:MAG: DUF885 domain-containing protein [Kofleriaceae bacterium]